MKVKVEVSLQNGKRLRVSLALPHGSSTGDVDEALAKNLLERSIDLNAVSDWRITAIDL